MGVPVLGLEAFKMMLKQCSCGDDNTCSCADQCPVCDGTFFHSLRSEMSAVISCFNDRVQELVNLHLAKGFRKFLLCLNGNRENDPAKLIRKCQELIKYAMMNAMAMRKILKKYDKIHHSNHGQKFKSEAPHMRIEILQSPWLRELMACYINLTEKNVKDEADSLLSQLPSLTVSDGKPILACEGFDYLKVNVDLNCAICLNTVYDAVALTCGHIFCYLCACSAASVNIVDGLNIASPEKKCPICREGAVYEGAVRLKEVNSLVRRRCPKYWKERFLSERTERLQLAKTYWDSQAQSFLGI